MSIRNSFILILLFSIAAIAGGVSFAAHIYANKTAAGQFARISAAQLDRVEDIIHTYLRAGEQAAKNLANAPETHAAALDGSATAAAPLARRLEALLAAVPGAEATFCGFSNGTFISFPVTTTPEGFDPRAQSWYSDAAWGRSGVSVTDAFISATSKGLAVTMAAKIKNGAGDAMGVAAVDISLSELNDTLRDMRLGHTGYLVLFDAKGRVLLDPKAQENLMQPAANTGDPALLSLVQQKQGMQTITRNNVHYTVFSRILSDTRWKAAFLMEQNEQVNSSRESLRLLIAIASAVALVLAGIGIFLAVVITRPLHMLISQSGALADGNVDALAGIPGRGPDITTLHGNLGRLTGRVMLLAQAEKEKTETARIQSLQATDAQEKAQMANKAVKETHLGLCRQTAETLTPISTGIATGVTALLQWNKPALEGTAMATVTASAAHCTMVDLAQNAASLATQAAEAETIISASMTGAQSAVALAQELSHALDAAHNLTTALLPGLEPLKNTAGDVTAATAAVRGLADETNMLALKISIEVAGAGAMGKDFAPFADGMRTLAEKNMALAASMDTITTLFEHSHTAHALNAGKSAACVKRAHTAAAKAEKLLATLNIKLASSSEQVRVLATSLTGAAEQGKTGVKSADATLRKTREAGNALENISAVLSTLTTLSAHLAAVAHEMDTSSRIQVPTPNNTWQE